MKIPKKLKIGGFDWTVRENYDITYEGNCYGSTHHGRQNIFLDPNMSQAKKQETLLHEIMHACYWQAGLIEFEKKDKITEEQMISSMAMSLYQVLKDNKLDFSK